MKINSELSFGTPPNSLEPATYYAYLDSIEKINGISYLRFDCIDYREANSTEISITSIQKFPSIVIEVSARHEYFDKLLGIEGIFSLFKFESEWLILRTEKSNSESKLFHYFNFSLGEESTNESEFSIAELTPFANMDEAQKRKVTEFDKATSLKISKQEDIQTFLNGLTLNNFDHINVYNVGQGNCNALVDKDQKPLLYFDVGGGYNANQSTFPNHFSLCHCLNPNVILSHWDMDHIVLAMNDPRLLATKWLAPYQKISNTAAKIASYLSSTGNLLVWGPTLPERISFGKHYIVKCRGKLSNKNNSGLALYIHYSKNKYVFLPGDAAFQYIPQISSIKELIGMVASHHGANSSTSGRRTPFSSNYEGMIAYSYGFNNTHKHPLKAAIKEYESKGWVDRLDTIGGNIALKRSATPITSNCVSGSCTLGVNLSFNL
jgi:hypothetical protein